LKKEFYSSIVSLNTEFNTNQKEQFVVLTIAEQQMFHIQIYMGITNLYHFITRPSICSFSRPLTY